MNNVIATPALPGTRAGRSDRTAFPVLIEVPALRDLSAAPRRRQNLRFESESTGRRSLHGGRRTRRRLKREVKVAACLLFICLPVIYQTSRVWSGRLGNIAASDLTRTVNPDDGKEETGLGSNLARKVSKSVFEPAVVLMSIEPAQGGLKTEAEAPVVFPGYLLPVDSLEEMAHEGS